MKSKNTSNSAPYSIATSLVVMAPSILVIPSRKTNFYLENLSHLTIKTKVVTTPVLLERL
jgi:hypothetical protein